MRSLCPPDKKLRRNKSNQKLIAKYNNHNQYKYTQSAVASIVEATTQKEFIKTQKIPCSKFQKEIYSI